MALGAPSRLLELTSRALSDEIRHTELTLQWAERFTGERWSIAALPEAVAPMHRADRSSGLEPFFRDVFRGGAIGETLAAVQADSDSEQGPPEMSAFYKDVAADEARHAALAFETLRWLIHAFPTLQTVCDEEMATFRHTATAREWLLVAPLLPLLGEAEVESRLEATHG
jgi:hypothetical protein